MSSQLFVQKYQLYLPYRDALQREMEATLIEAAQPPAQSGGEVRERSAVHGLGRLEARL